MGMGATAKERIDQTIMLHFLLADVKHSFYSLV
jgi:hypothetical protein